MFGFPCFVCEMHIQHFHIKTVYTHHLLSECQILLLGVKKYTHTHTHTHTHKLKALRCEVGFEIQGSEILGFEILFFSSVNARAPVSHHDRVCHIYMYFFLNATA